MRGEVPTIRPDVPAPRGDAEWFAQTGGAPRPTLHHANRQSSIRNHRSEAVYEYDVYGQVAASDPNHPNRFLFTGREFDAETGLYYYRARYYNPTIGRFLQTDPVGYEDGTNVYRYCGNNPLNYTDPSGEEAEKKGSYVPGYATTYVVGSYWQWAQLLGYLGVTHYMPVHFATEYLLKEKAGKGPDDAWGEPVSVTVQPATYYGVKVMNINGINILNGVLDDILRAGDAMSPQDSFHEINQIPRGLDLGLRASSPLKKSSRRVFDVDSPCRTWYCGVMEVMEDAPCR